MNKSTSEFNQLAGKSKAVTKRPAPLSIRLTAQERQQLEVMAARVGLSSFIKEQIFKDQAQLKPKYKKQTKAPVKDQQALA